MRRRTVLVLLGLVLLLPVLAVGAAVLLFDGEALRTRVVAAVERATGRTLTVAGPVRLAWSLAPAVSMEGVSLANPPGFSRPAMAVVDRLDVQLALWPLLQRRVEIRSLTLTGPDVLLERDAAGRPNWVFGPADAPAPTGPSAAPAAPASRQQVSLDVVRVRDGRLGWLSGGTLHRIEVPFMGAETSAARVVTVGGNLVADGLQLAVGGTTGALSNAGGAWPLDLKVLSAARGLSARVVGTWGVNVALTAELDDLSELSGLAGRALPALRGVRASAQLGPSGLSALTAQAALDAGPLRLTRLALSTDGLDRPVVVTAEGVLAAAGAAAVPVSLSGNVTGLLQPGPVPVQVRMQAGAAAFTADGTADLRAGALEAQVSARVPDMQALGAAAGLRLPAMRDVALDSRMSAAGPGRLLLRGLRLTWPGSDLAGDLALVSAPRPSVKGSLVSERLALDGIAAAPAPARPVPGPPPTAPPLPAPPAPARLLSDAPLPFDALRRADVDVQLAVNELSWRGAAARAVAGRVLLQDGRLQLGPATAQMPGGTISAQVSADAGAQTAGIVLQAQDIAAGPVLALFGAPQGGTGSVDLDIDLRSQGASPRVMGAALSGHAGLALVDGEFDLGGLLAAAGDVLRRANLPLEAGGRSRVRCLALRLDAAAGQMNIGTLLLDSARLHLDGEGGLNLGDETLDLHLRPQVRLGVGGVSVPVRVSGPLRTPKIEAEIKGGAGRQGLMIGAPTPPDDCGPRLTAARGGRAGTMPSAPAETPRIKPADLLRSLLR